MTRVPKVRAWSNTVRKGQFHPADVDLFVLRDHEPVLAALGRERADAGGTKEAPERDRLALVRGVAMLAPVFSLLTEGGRVRGTGGETGPMDEEVAVVYCAVLFLLALPGPTLLALRWLAAHRRRDGLEVISLAFTTLAGASVLTRMITEWYVEPFGLSTWPVWLTIVSAAITLVMVLVASRGRRSQGDLCFRVVGDPDPAKTRQMIDALPSRMREQLHDMRTRAVENLRKRGLVDDDEAHRITSTPLGEAPAARG